MNSITRFLSMNAVPGYSNLYISDARTAAATNPAQLAAVISVGSEFTEQPSYPCPTIHIRVPVDDVPTETINRYFSTTNQFIHNHRRRGAVLVHCAAGISRSSTIILSYMLAVPPDKGSRHNFDTALLTLRQARPIVWPNVGFQWQLKHIYGAA